MATTLGRRARHVLDVREPAAPLLHVPGGGHAGQVAELAHEVGVVGEPAGRGHVGDGRGRRLVPVPRPGDQQPAPPPGTAGRARRWSARARPGRGSGSAGAGGSSRSRRRGSRPPPGRGPRSGVPRRGRSRGRAACASGRGACAASRPPGRGGPASPVSRRGGRAARRGRAPRRSSSAAIRLVSSERGRSSRRRTPSGARSTWMPCWWPANAVSTAPSCMPARNAACRLLPPGPDVSRGSAQDRISVQAPCGASRRRSGAVASSS